MSPVARPVASTRLERSARTFGAFDGLSAANDSPSPRPSRISQRLLAEIGRDLTPLDQEILDFVAAVRLATGGQLTRRFFGDRPADGRSARRVFYRLTQWRVLDRLPRRVGGIRAGSASFVYGVGVAGARLLAVRDQHVRRLGTPGDRYVDHTLAITELLVRLNEADRAGELDLIAAETEPRCWRPFPAAGGARLVLKPDLFIRVGVGALEDRWFVEVDRATETSGTLVEKARRYLVHYRSGSEQRTGGVYPRVLWTVPDERRQEQVREAFVRLPEGLRRLMAIWLFDEVVDRISEEARS